MQAPNNFGCCGTKELLFRKGKMCYEKLKSYDLTNGEHCSKQMSYFKVPKYWMFKDTFPLTVTGKVKKFEIRDISIQELGLENNP